MAEMKHETGHLEAESQITFTWSHIDVRTQSSPSSEFQSQHLLRDVSGIAYPGELLVIMGPSGAGKTTLLNCLTRRNLKGLNVSGNVYINRKPFTKSELASLSAYTQQDYLFIGCLTVREHLIFQALLRLNSSYEEKLQRVEQVLRELSLKNCENVQIGMPGLIKGISAGERRRLALASEFLINPFLIFFDEPTTGLDSFMSLNVVQTLKRIAREGRTVIATLHQPSSEIFHLIDKLCLVTEGRTAFLGTTSQATDFFTQLKIPCPRNFNPAEYYIQVLSILPGKEKQCKQCVENIADTFKTSCLGKKIDTITEDGMMLEPSNSSWPGDSRVGMIYRNGCYSQLKGLFWRSYLTVIKNPESTGQRTRLIFIEAVFIFFIYNGIIMNQDGISNMEGVISYVLISLSFKEVFCAISACCWEKSISIKEHNDGLYRLDLYFLTKMLCEIPLSLVCDMFVTTVCYLTFGKTIRVSVGEYLTALFISILLGQVAQGLGFIISFLAPDVEMAPALVNMIVAPLMMLGGIFINLSSIPFYLKWLSDFSWFKYAFEAFMINLWSSVKYIPCHTNATLASDCLNNGSEVLNSLSIRADGFWASIGHLVFLAIIFRIAALLILLHKSSKFDS